MGYPGSGSLGAVFFPFAVLVVSVFNTVLVSAGVLKLVDVDMDLSRVDRRVDERFLSVTIDASLVAEEKFMYLLG